MSEKIIEKIQAILDLAASEKKIGNVEAAESYALIVQRLLIKHKLEFEDVTGHKAKDKDPLTSVVLQPHSWGGELKPNREAYAEDLAKVIAEAFFCRLLVYLDNNALLFVGRKSDIDIAQYIFCAVMRAGLMACEVELSVALFDINGAGANERVSWGASFNDEFRYSFFTGYNSRIAYRLHEQRRKIEIEAGECQALVRVEKEVDNFLEDEIRPGKEERLPERAAVIKSAQYKGILKGEEANLSPNGLDGEKPNLQIGD